MTTKGVPHVWWVTGRRKALARAVALHSAKVVGLDWGKIGPGAQRGLIAAADEAVGVWVANQVLIQFPAEFREPQVSTERPDPTEKHRK